MLAPIIKSLRLYVIGLMVALAGALSVLPLLSGQAGAAQITNRSLSISSGIPSQTSVVYTFGVTLPSSGTVQSLKFEACIAAVGTCNAPSGISFSSAAWSAQTFSGAQHFIPGAGAGGCTSSASVLCANRTDGTTETGAKTVAFSGITNPSAFNTSFFVHITTYSDNAYGTPVDTGTAASATVQSLTANAAVAEILNFCVGSTLIDNATASVGTDCSAVTGTSVNLGTLDPTTINTTPVSTNGGDNKNGVAMVRTNASNGVTVSYDAIQQSGTNHKGTLRISGAACTAGGGITTDQCINAAGTTQTTFTAGTEEFGMTTDDNCGSTTSYTCVSTGGSHSNALTPFTNYLGAGTTGTPAYGTSNGFAWDESGATQQIASSTGVVDDEALILKFAATPNITTPFGAYSAQADFIAVPTY